MVKISVVIPSYNEEAYIGKVLKALKEQDFKDYEVIVVDKASTDRTREIARKYAKVIIEKRKGIGLARNIGAAAAKGEILLFLDADTVPSKTLFSTYAQAFSDPKVVEATGPILPLEKVNMRIYLGYIIVSVLYVGLSIAFGMPNIVGSNFAVRKDAFFKVGGFNERFYTYEDWDLSKKLGRIGKAKFILNAKVYTSARRIFSWGVSGFFKYHVGNIIRYHTVKKPKEEYEPIR